MNATLEVLTPQKKDTMVPSARLKNLKEDVMHSPYSICVERAVLVTEYFKKKENKNLPLIVRKAEALAHVLTHKTCRIYPNELIVGSTTSKRVAGPLYPELHGLPIMEDLLSFTTRKVNPLQITGKEKLKLVKDVAPYWLNKFMAYKSLSGKEIFSFVADQLHPKFFLINETGGIGHLVPDYEMVINNGLEAVIVQAKMKMRNLTAEDERYHFYQAVQIICVAVIKMAHKYADEATKLAEAEDDTKRKAELLQIAENLKQVPAQGASNLQEALQSIWMLHSAVTLEGLDNGISFGRMDQYLYPFYKKDIETGALTKQQAKELLGCFTIKSAEIIPVFSNSITASHGGFLSGQALTIGGTDKNGKDVTNDLSYIFLDLMDEVRMRQPNYHARVHSGSPAVYINKIMQNLAKGVNSPAIYNDELIVRSLERCGFSHDDAMEYSTLGCVELCAAGKTFGSTDAALVNVPLCLEMALNRGKLFGSSSLSGFPTNAPEHFESITDLQQAFKTQLNYQIDRLQKMLAPIEIGNREYHPTPLTSAMTQGCIEKGKDVTTGGAVYNFSGVQGVGITDTGDSLFAINELVFMQKKYSMAEVIAALKNNFKGEEKMRLEFLNVPKFGNDNKEADRYSKWVVDSFYDTFEDRYNTRGGRFVAGFYSTTTHYSFGLHTGAMASGRLKGTPFTSGIAPANGADRKGPTALFNSVASIDFERAHNGVNVNAKFDTATLKGEHGKDMLRALLLTYFKKGGMQVQLNVLDTEMLKHAKEHPEEYPWLIVRVSGYSAYFNDLSPAMKDEIIQRSSLSC